MSYQPTDHVPYVAYEVVTGRIVSFGECPYEVINLQAQQGQATIIGLANPRSQWVNGSALLDRPTISVEDVVLSADGIEDVIAVGIPSGTRVFVDNEDMGNVDNSGIIMFTPVEPGELAIRLEPPFPYMIAEFTVTVNEVGP